MNPEIIGTIAGLFTALNTIPQLVKSIKTKSVSDVSLGMLLMIIAGVSLWLIFGIMIKSSSMIFWNSVGLIVNLCNLYLKIIYL